MECQPPGPAPRPTLKVLVVEDEPDAATTTGELVRLFGHDVRVCRDGPTALREAPDFRPDVVLLDIALPQMDGYTVAQRLREQVGPEPLIIAVSGFQEADRQRAGDSGIALYLLKPVQPDDLQQLLARCERWQ